MHNKSLKFFYILPHRYLNVLKGDVTLFDNMLWYRAKKGVNWLFQVMVPSRLINSNQTMREMSPGIENNCWFSRGIFLSASPASGGDIDVLFVIKVIDPVLYTSELKNGGRRTRITASRVISGSRIEKHFWKHRFNSAYKI